VVIFSAQIGDLLGLQFPADVRIPAEFLGKWECYFEHLASVNWHTVGLSAFSLAIVLFWPRVTKKVPSPLVAMVMGTLAALVLGLHVETIGSRFGGIPSTLPAPSLPDIGFNRMGWSQLHALIGPAVVIALLAAIESLLSAVVADGMIGGQHRPN